MKTCHPQIFRKMDGKTGRHDLAPSVDVISSNVELCNSFIVMLSIQLTEEILQELLFFAENPWEEHLTQTVLKDKIIAVLLKRNSEVLSSNIDDVICQMLFGNCREPPGMDNCPYQRLQTEEDEEGNRLPGVWTPPNPLTKGTVIKLLFPNVCAPYKMPEVPVIPPHIAVGYDAFKYKDLMELAAQYPGHMMKYGFFTSDIPGDAKLIVKTVTKFEKRTEPPTYEEKIVIQLSKADLDAVLAFSELGPTYMSPNTVDGEKECLMFFPPGYDEPEEDVTTSKKKSRKKSNKSAMKAVNTANTPESAVQQDANIQNKDGGAPDSNAANNAAENASETTDHPEDEENNLELEENDENEAENGDEEGEADEITGTEGADKATSPIETVNSA